MPKSRETNGLLMLRGVANAFQEDTTLAGDEALWAKDVSRTVPCCAQSALGWRVS